MSAIPRYPPALAEESLEYFFASSSNASPACSRLRRPAASSSVFTMIRRRPTPTGCWAEAETAIVSVRKRWHRRLRRMTDLLLGMCEPVGTYLSRAVTRAARLVEVRKIEKGMRGCRRTAHRTSRHLRRNRFQKGLRPVSLHFDALVFNDVKVKRIEEITSAKALMHPLPDARRR